MKKRTIKTKSLAEISNKLEISKQELKAVKGGLCPSRRGDLDHVGVYKLQEQDFETSGCWPKQWNVNS